MAVTALELEKNAEIEGFSKTCRLKSELLFAGKIEILIEHKGDEYRLRITKNDKLILTK
jgi:hemin uptake protein HemP